MKPERHLLQHMLNQVKEVWKNKKSRLITVFLLVLLGGLGIALSIILRKLMLFKNYNNPPTIYTFTILFEYIAASFIVFLFPWSWKAAKSVKQRVLYVSLSAIGFILIYIFIASLLEWAESPKIYSLWKGFTFTLVHSGPFTAVIYVVLAINLSLLGLTSDNRKTTTSPERIPYTIKNTTHYADVTKISLFEANGNYVAIHTAEGDNHLIRKTLNQLAEQLDQETFIRIHRKYIINLNHITGYKADPNGGYNISLANDKQVKLSKGYIKKLQLIKKLS